MLLMTLGITLSAPQAFAAPAADPTHNQIARLVQKADPASASPPKELTVSGRSVRVANIELVLADASEDAATVDGVRTFDGKRSDFAVRGTADGVQALSVVSARTSETSATYRFPGKTLTEGRAGTVIVRKDGAKGEPVGVIDAPWAKDAEGRSVTTWYQLRGDTLVQYVKPTARTVYPVVADPRVRSTWYGWSVDFTKKETNLIAAGGGACAAIAAYIPEPAVSKAVAAGCGLIAVWAGYASAEGKCVSIKIIGRVAAAPWIAKCYA